LIFLIIKRSILFFIAGDFIAPFTIVHLEQLACEWRGVFGNNDGERQGLIRVSSGRIIEGIMRVEISGARIVMAHNASLFDMRAKEKADIFICGHTHKPEVVTKGHRIIVNPGEACGWLSGVSTVAVIDLNDRSARIHAI